MSRGRLWRTRGVVVLISALVLVALSLSPWSAGAATTAAPAATTDTSPVDLATKINLGDGVARQGATIATGEARFEVLTPEVIRMEYAAGGSFLDLPTHNVLNRNLAVPPYETSQQDGWLTIRTTGMVLRYRLGSGAFSPTNTQVQLLSPSANGTTNVQPSWEWECTFGQVCQAGAATLSGGAAIATDHHGHVSPPGFVAGYNDPGAAATWQLLGAPAGAATATIRYSNGSSGPRTITLFVNGQPTQVSFPSTGTWENWGTITAPVTMRAGQNTVAVGCAAGDDCHVNVDDVSVTVPGATAEPVLPADPLGGYIRSFDSANGSYSAAPSCGPGESGATCEASNPPMAQGMLDKSGWYLLDDTRTAVWTADGWVAPRPAGDTQDGYLFGYGENYAAALQDLAKLTGPAPLLPEYTFGNWFSQYHPYSAADYQNQLLPDFRKNGVSLDTLSVDTDWKSPNQWNGWNWNPALFPDPAAFLSWAKSNDIHPNLNIHSGITTSDPQYALAQSVAGNTLNCPNSSCVWDWSKIPQAESNFAVQQPIQDQGVNFWWLDWCCDASNVSLPGVTPDSWINHLYAQDLVNTGQRGFVLGRIGASVQNSTAGSYSAGPWTSHRSAIHFTGDTQSTWNTLAMQAQLAPDEASIGQPYVSNDIGGFLGAPGGGPNDPDDLYLRWLQLGTFQPIMREHANLDQNARLPWKYNVATQATGDKFLQLREQLVPYLYTLSQQASATGLPMTHPLYLDYPDQPTAYDNPGEYLLGSDLLVAPVTSPGNVATTQVWFPPGNWTDWFTGATFTGPATQTLPVPLDRMPVFVKAGGIVPLQPASGHAQTAGSAPLTLQVFSGADGSYRLYDDAGDGLGYQQGQSASTVISHTQDADGQQTLDIGTADGTYPGQPATRNFQARFVDTTEPAQVIVNGAPLPKIAVGGDTPGWWYDAGTRSASVNLPATPTAQSVHVALAGTHVVTQPEPPTLDLHLTAPPDLGAGKQATVQATITNHGPGPANGSAITLNAPAGWTVQPSSPVSLGDLAPGQSASASWTVTAPCADGALDPAMLTAKASYTYGTAARQGSAQDLQTVNLGQPFSITAPANLAPGTTTTVTTDMTNTCAGSLGNVSVNLTAPSGWTVQATLPSSFGSVAGGQTVDTTWAVSVPTDAQLGSAQLNAIAGYTAASGPGGWTASKPVFVPGTVSVVLGQPNQSNGLYQLDFNYPGDGATQPVTVGGISGRESNSGWPHNNNLYFNVDDRIAYNGNYTATFTFQYYDQGTDTVYLQYDGRTAKNGYSASYSTVPVLNRTNTDTWKTATVTVNDARFANSENDGADFRLNTDTSLALHNMDVAVSSNG